MQALAQRVSSAKVCIDGETHSSINLGVLVFVCFEKDDMEDVIDKFISKISNFSFFKENTINMSSNLKDIDAELMIISQFTLAAETNKGNKPSFHRAAGSEKANFLYSLLIKKLTHSPIRFESGVFGADMDVHSVNSGPVTFSFTI